MKYPKIQYKRNVHLKYFWKGITGYYVGRLTHLTIKYF